MNSWISFCRAPNHSHPHHKHIKKTNTKPGDLILIIKVHFVECRKYLKHVCLYTSTAFFRSHCKVCKNSVISNILTNTFKVLREVFTLTECKLNVFGSKSGPHCPTNLIRCNTLRKLCSCGQTGNEVFFHAWEKWWNAVVIVNIL